MVNLKLNPPAAVPATDARVYNRDAVTRLARERGVVTRADLANTLGLHKATVSRVVRELLEERVLLEGPTVANPRAGRSTTSLVFNPAAAAIVAIELEETGFKISEADGRGGVLRERTSTAAAGLDGDAVLRELRAAIERLSVASVSAATIAASSTAMGTDASIRRLAGDSRKMLEEAGVPVTIRPLAEMGALGARSSLSPNVASFAFVSVGSHVEFAYSSQGRVMQGALGLLGCVETVNALGVVPDSSDVLAAERLYRVCAMLDASYSPEEIVVASDSAIEVDVRRTETRMRQSTGSAPRIRSAHRAVITQGCVESAVTRTHTAIVR